MMNPFRSLYRRLVPYETRYWLYKQRHKSEFIDLRSRVNQSAKGNFSLRKYDQLQCIFVHITKTAGTSVATGMFGELPYHYTSVQYRVIFGRKIFADYFKFAFVRNPWDRLYSAWKFLKQGGWDEKDAVWAKEHLGEFSDFNDFVLNWLTPESKFSYLHFWPQCCFITDRHGNCLIDFIGYYEELTRDFNLVSEKIGVKTQLPHINPSKKDDYRTVYTSESINRVASIYREDIERLGYQFDSFDRVTPW